jgi:hypothetical protein
LVAFFKRMNRMDSNEKEQRTYILSLEESKNQKIKTLKVNNLYIHSKYSPLIEAEKIGDSSYKKNHLHILFGLGLGYIPQMLSKKFSDTDSLLIIEPNQELLKIALQFEENILLLAKENVQICVGEDIDNLKYQLNAYFQQYMGRFTIINTPNYPNLYPEFYKLVLETAKEQLMMEVINNNTRQIFSEQWQENYISNLYHGYQAQNITDIAGKLTCPVVVASGGPSLTKQLPMLKKIKNKALIICAGSTINSLLKANIIPDLIVTVDGGIPNYNHFKNLEIDNIPIVYPLIVHKGIPSSHNGEQIVFNISDHTLINKWTDKLLSQEVGTVHTGHSVANFSLDIAYQLTEGPICLIGQDLAYTNNQTHAEGNQGFSIIDKEKENKRKMFQTEGYYGKNVLTDYVFLGMKNSFENHLAKIRKKDHNREIINATEGGIKIEGFKQMPFKEFIDTFCEYDCSRELKALIPSKKTPDWQAFYKEILALLDQYEEVKKLADMSVDILNGVKRNNYMFNKKFNKKLGDSDEKLKILLENEFIYYILRPVMFKVQHSFLEELNETEEETNRRIYEKSLLLYKGIKGAAEQGITWIKELKEKVEQNL